MMGRVVRERGVSFIRLDTLASLLDSRWEIVIHKLGGQPRSAMTKSTGAM